MNKFTKNMTAQEATRQIRRRVALEAAGVKLVRDGALDRAALGRKVVDISPFGLLPMADRDPAIQAGLGKYVGHHLRLSEVLADLDAV